MPLVGSGGVPISLEFQTSKGNTDAAFADMTKRAQELSRELDKLADTRKEREKSIKSGTSAVKDFAQSWYFIKNLAGDIVQATQAIFEFAQAGAQMSRMRDSFMSLRDDGTGALNALREASRGTIADYDLMLAANQAQLLGVGRNVEELANLLEIAAFRGRAMGLSTTQAFSDMVRGIGRTSPMILDNLGIIVDAESTYSAWAETIGKTKDELTKQDKVNALLNKTLVQGNALMEQSGGLAHDNAEEYEQVTANLANLKSALQEAAGLGFAPLIEAANNSLEGTSQFRDEITDVNEVLLFYGENLILSRSAHQMYAERIEEVSNELARATQYGLAWERALGSQAEAVETAVAPTETYVADLEKLLSLQESISDETQNFNDKQADNLKKQDEVKAKIAELIAQGYGPWHEKIKDLEEDYTRLGDEYNENAEKHRDAMNRIQYDLLITKLSVDGLTTEEKAMADAAGLYFGVLDQQAIDTAGNFDAVSQAVVDGKLKVQDMQKALELMAKGYKIDVVMNIIKNMGHDQYSPGTYSGFASGTGGWRTVPSGYPNDSYPIGLTSGEKFAVIPPGGSAGDMGGNSTAMQGGGGNVSVTLVLQSAVSLADRDTLENVLMPAIEQGMRKLKAEGKFR